MDTFFCHNVGVRIREVPPTCMCLQMSVETIALPLVVSIVNGGLALVVSLQHSLTSLVIPLSPSLFFLMFLPPLQPPFHPSLTL